ncbi:putative ferredoxin [Chryseobacterium sp. StRB126]|nr:putative ferredoxin [Chryseobacterium sp. StRB126]
MKDEITITVTDQTGIEYTLICPLEMGLTLKDICKAYELPMEAMCG